MQITIRLFATLRAHYGKELSIELPEHANGHQAIQQLNICEDEVSIYLINGRSSELQVILHENDTISIFPPVGGG